MDPEEQQGPPSCTNLGHSMAFIPLILGGISTTMAGAASNTAGWTTVALSGRPAPYLEPAHVVQESGSFPSRLVVRHPPFEGHYWLGVNLQTWCQPPSARPQHRPAGNLFTSPDPHEAHLYRGGRFSHGLEHDMRHHASGRQGVEPTRVWQFVMLVSR